LNAIYGGVSHPSFYKNHETKTKNVNIESTLSQALLSTSLFA
jgi:hypothetical protein